MIFVTVGTQLPFERLVKGVDEWARKHSEEEVYVQSGETEYRPTHCKCVPFTSPQQWEELFQRATRVVSHAGMGTLLKSLDYGKPLIIMPRIAMLGEHRNDHQLATAKRFAHFANITVVHDEFQLAAALNCAAPNSSTDGNNNKNLRALISDVRRFIHTGA